MTAAKLDGGIIASTVDEVTITTTGAASAAEVPTLASVVPGAVTASKLLLVDAQSSLDTVRARTNLNLGGTGVPGAAMVQTEITKVVTGLQDTVATDVLTVTVPNAAHAAFIEVDVLGIKGAGGAIGAGEATLFTTYRIALARTAGVAVVPIVSAALATAAATVAGGDALASVGVKVSALTGAVGAPQTVTILVAITRAGAGADNHVAAISARILNRAASGVTIA